MLCLIPFFALSNAQQIRYWKRGEMIPVSTNDTITIALNQTKIILWDSTILFPGPYSYRLQGFRNQWSEFTHDSFLVLESIGDNHYSLEIKNNRGNYFAIPLMVEKNESRFFLFTWILLGCGAAIGLMGWGYKRQQSLRCTSAEADNAQPLSIAITQNRDSDNNLKSQKYKKVTVLFADIQGFTKIVEHMNPEQLIDELDRFFIFFDEVVERFNIEKIKTIGDAYMCAGGLPEKNRTNPVDVVLAAMAMQSYVKSMQHSKGNNDFGFWELRIGIHTGSVISGMIGHKKRYFDIWGDSVNIASRMESSGIAGEINITGITYNMIKDFFVCEYRGKMPIKYKGETDMYFVKGIVPALSVNNEGKTPNRKFMLRLQHIAFFDLLDYLAEQIINTYTTNKWFSSFLITAETLARTERVTDEELLLIKTAGALAFPTMIHADHQTTVIQLAPTILQTFRYSDEQKTQILRTIDHITLGFEPGSIEEGIISDAFHATLMRKNFLQEYLASRENNTLAIQIPTEVHLGMITEKMISHKPYTSSHIDLLEITPNNQIGAIKLFIKNKNLGKDK